VTQTAVPVALAPLLLGERFTSTPLSGAPLALSLAVLIAGAAVLARSPLLLALMEGERAGTTSEPLEEEATPANPRRRADGHEGRAAGRGDRAGRASARAGQLGE
jgi:hypothetical protein